MAEEELERFRREWQAEVRAREQTHGRTRGGSHSSNRHGDPGEAPKSTRELIEDDRVFGASWNFDDLEEKEQARQLGESSTGIHPEAQAAREPETALEFYEKAVDCETQGRLGESLAHYRKAFRLNDRVDQQYKSKHFPPSSSRPTQKAASTENESTASVRPRRSTKPTDQSRAISELVASFVDSKIEGEPPPIEGAPAPKCPIAMLPAEMLNLVLLDCAMKDVASFARLSRVCRRLAYLVAAEDSVWKQVCHSSKYGFSGMHVKFACKINGEPLSQALPKLDDLSLSDEADPLAKVEKDTLEPSTLPLSPTYPAYSLMFRHRPRIRLPGVYISTVNYVRPGQASPNQITWNTPVHVVTYYRYLRFYRDGSCISLLTTVDPPEVVPFLKSEYIGETPSLMASPGFAAVAKHTLRGRWRMSPLHSATGKQSDPEEDIEPEGNVLVETAGPTPAYTYSMQLALRSTGGKGPRNTKLAWRGFWSYNKITDDWAEFGLRNDRAFVWSRVKSWSDE